MAKNRSALARRALEKLLVVGSGNPPEPEDIEQVDGVIDAVVADLDARHVFTVQDLTDIDIRAFEWIADCLAVMVASDFGQTPDEAKRMKAENMLITISATRPSKEAAMVDYF
jgi:hypothetical protein